MTLKEQVAADIHGVFLSLRDFGDFHTVNGSRVLCLIEKNNVHMRAPAGRRTEGVREDSLFLYIHAGEFRTVPKPHDPLEVDGRKFFVRSVSEEMGILVIEYGAVSDGRRISGRQ